MRARWHRLELLRHKCDVECGECKRKEERRACEADLHAQDLGFRGAVAVGIHHRVAHVEECGLEVRHGLIRTTDGRGDSHRGGLHFRLVGRGGRCLRLLAHGEARDRGFVLVGERLIQIGAVVDARAHVVGVRERARRGALGLVRVLLW